MEDFVNSIKAHLYDRISSPLLSSFIVSWLAWNHRLLVVLVSDLKLVEKFSYVDEILYPTWIQFGGRGFLFPLLSALFLLYIYPIPARKVYQHVRAEQHRLKELQQSIDDEMPMTKEDASALRQALRRAMLDAEQEIRSRDETILRLKSEMENTSVELKRVVGELNQFKEESLQRQVPKLDADQVEILAKIADTVDGIKNIDIIHLLPQLSQVMRQTLLERLERQGLITKSYPAGETMYMATADGRDYLLKIDHPVMRRRVSSRSLPG